MLMTYTQAFERMKLILNNQPSYREQYKINCKDFGRKVKGYKPEDPRRLSSREIIEFDKLMIGILRQWKQNGHSEDWDCEEIPHPKYCRLRFSRDPKQTIRSSKKMYDIKCSDCGKDTKAPFKPVGDRQFYCKKCHQNHRSKVDN